MQVRPPKQNKSDCHSGYLPLNKIDCSENSGRTAEKWNDIFQLMKPIPHSPAGFLCKTKMENLSVVLFGEDSEESKILYELVEESHAMLLLAATSSFMGRDVNHVLGYFD